MSTDRAGDDRAVRASSEAPRSPLIFIDLDKTGKLCYFMAMHTKDCLFCDYKNPAKNTIVAENSLAYARWDNYPASAGHVEVVPKRHVVSFFDLTPSELAAVYDLAKKAKKIIVGRHNPDGFTIGVNEGEAAGRTVHHLHLHLIPRYIGDVKNPRGGIRHVIPGKGDY
jgi:diadenosine tetraphosphate (Ap4A) HIT family hydrolase